MIPCRSSTGTPCPSSGRATADPARPTTAPTAATTIVRAAGKPDLLGSADRPFRGDVDRWNPEETLISALAQCHLLSYLHAAATAGVVVVGYSDQPTGTMRQTDGGGGHFVEVTLRPVVTIRDPAHVELATSLHQGASERCFIASSVNFPVHHEPRTVLAADASA